MRNTLALVLLFFTMVTGCSGNDQKQPAAGETTKQAVTSQQAAPQMTPAAGFRSVSPADAKKLIESRKDLLIIDVRSPEELRQGAIENSTLIPFWQILRGQQTLPKDKPLLLVCAVGGRSYAVAQVLQRQGYPELYNLSGGIDAWKQAGLPLKY